MAGSARPDDSIPWPLDTEQRYFWLREGQKVGETRFRIEELPRAGGEKVLVVTSRRAYDHQGISQRAESTTVLTRKLVPLHFEEKLTISALTGSRSTQDLEIDVKDGVARASWIHNGNAAKPNTDARELPEGCFLHASQAVDHWALFMTALPEGATEHLLQLYYPDFGRVLDVTFTARSEEVLDIGGELVPTTRYEFQAEILRGRAWRDEHRRLVQVEFPESGLRVVLAPASKADARSKRSKDASSPTPSPDEGASSKSTKDRTED